MNIRPKPPKLRVMPTTRCKRFDHLPGGAADIAATKPWACEGAVVVEGRALMVASFGATPVEAIANFVRARKTAMTKAPLIAAVVAARDAIQRASGKGACE